MRNIEFLNRGFCALKKFERRIDALDVAQRKLLFVGLLFVVILLSVATCFVPAHNHRATLMIQHDQLLTATQALQTVMNNNQQAEKQAQEKAIKAQKKLPATQNIAGLFRGFIKNNSALQLLQLTASPPIKLKEGDQDFIIDGKAVYSTELTLTISGSFENLFNYVQQLEHMPWYFFWKSMSYQVTKYPDATMVLTLKVLSVTAGKVP